MRRSLAVALGLVVGAGCKQASGPTMTFDAGRSAVAPRFLEVLAAPTSVEAVLLQLGHADGAEIFTSESDDITFDSSERGARVRLTPPQVATAQGVLFNEKSRGGGMPHWSFRANYGLVFHSGADEVRVVIGLEQYGHFYLSSGRGWQTLSVPPESRVAFTELGTALFGPAVTTDVLAPGRTINEFYQGRNETY